MAAPNDTPTTLTHIVLLGRMAVGKTTIGRALAEVLGMPFLDSDTEIAARTGRTGRQIAAADGVATLHRLEREVFVAALTHATPAVVAAAASVVDDPELVALLGDHHCVWLRADDAVLDQRRSSADHRRDLRSHELPTLTRRDAVYSELAALVIDTGRRTLAEAVSAVAAQWRSTVSGEQG